MDLEEALQAVGEFGPYQKQAVVVLVLTQVYMACQSMLIVLVGTTPSYQLRQTDSASPGPAENSPQIIFTEDVDSIVTEWFLIKQQAYKVSLAGSLFFAGLLLGNVIFGPLSDKVGRRPVYLTGLVERDLQWTSKTKEHAETKAQEQLALLGNVSTEVLGLQQTVESLCSDLRGSTADQLSAHTQQVNSSLQSLQRQTSQDHEAVGLQQAELLQRVEASERLVRGFLQEELQQDVPTGSTPQRRDFVYPHQLVKGRSRSELLESLRREQEALKIALEEDEEEEEEEEGEKTQVDQDSLEDEPSTCNESLATEPSFIDENLVFNESKRLPFFKKKKGSRKESKIPSRPKVAAESESSNTPQRSRLPLRCQN